MMSTAGVWRRSRLHQLLLGALGTDDVLLVGDETAPDQRRFAHGTDEAIVVPVAILERDEARTTNASDGLGTGGASLREQFTETFGTVRFLVAAGKALTGKRYLAVRTGEALTVPRFVLVRYTAARDDLLAFDASGGVLFLVAAGTVNFLLARNERFRADCGFAHAAAETLLVPLSGFVLHLLRACTEDFTATIATGRKLGIVTVATVDLVRLRAKLFVHQRDAAFVAQEACLVPVLILVREILRVDADGLVAFLTHVGEHVLVALDAVRMLVPQHVPLAG